MEVNHEVYDYKFEFVVSDNKFGYSNVLVYLMYDDDGDCIKHLWTIYGYNPNTKKFERINGIKLPTYVIGKSNLYNIIKSMISDKLDIDISCIQDI
jgi:hypothetical protein